MRIIESEYPKLFDAIDKVETDEDLKSDFEGIEDLILLCDHVANDKA